MSGLDILHTAGLNSLKTQHPIIPVNTIFMFAFRRLRNAFTQRKSVVVHYMSKPIQC